MLKSFSKILMAAVLIGGSIFGTVQAADNAAQTDAEIIKALEKEGGAVFPIGQPNTGYAKYFTGRSFLYMIANDGVSVVNVTFEPGCINFWHKHHGSCQVLAGVSGKGYYQIWGQPVQELLPGQSVTIPEGVKHWHGAQHHSWFQHVVSMKVGATTEWLEPVNPADYKKLDSRK